MATPGSDRSRVLVADDQPDVREALRLLLKSEGYTADLVESPAQVLTAIRARPYAALLFDLNYTRDTTSGSEGLAALPEILAADRDLPVIVMTAWGTIDLAVDAMRRGARDFIEKPWDNDRLLATLKTQVQFREVLKQANPPAQPPPALAAIEVEPPKTPLVPRASDDSQLRIELEGAASYIRAMLPEPLTEPFRVDWRFVPFSAVGGDAFGYHWIDEDNFALYILDVSGHGVPAALLSATALKVLRAGALPAVDFRDPGAVLTAMNNAFLMRDQNNLYFTIWYGVWHRATRELRYASAGHPPAILIESKAANGVVHLGAKGLVLGARAGKVYNTHVHRTAPGGQLYLVTDGIYEVLRPDGTMWPYEDFIACLRQLDPKTPQALDRLLTRLSQVHGSESQDDDVSIVQFSW
ncbi:hypothetical protein AYO41_01480 [Verrucomicrobia bacterium SCGC AG-212-E04]|nr:hypothetical protein AYO41_01480 [Verrucomicrobia bacterium SCGC AG-212-E04]